MKKITFMKNLNEKSKSMEQSTIEHEFGEVLIVYICQNNLKLLRILHF